MPPRKSKPGIEKNNVVARFLKHNDELINLIVGMIREYPINLTDEGPEAPEAMRILSAAALSIAYQADASPVDIFLSGAATAAASQFQWEVLKDEVERRLKTKA